MAESSIHWKFSGYLTLNNIVTVKSGLEVTQDHSNWYCLRNIWSPTSLNWLSLACRGCDYYTDYVRCSRSSSYRLLRPINCQFYIRPTLHYITTRKLGRGFLFTFHSNYGSVLHHFRDKARYWWKILIIFIPSCIRRPRWGWGRRSIPRRLVRKTRIIVWLLNVEKCRFDRMGVWRTDRLRDILSLA